VVHVSQATEYRSCFNVIFKRPLALSHFLVSYCCIINAMFVNVQCVRDYCLAVGFCRFLSLLIHVPAIYRHLEFSATNATRNG
jgi:hypothetical protein